MLQCNLGFTSLGRISVGMRRIYALFFPSELAKSAAPAVVNIRLSRCSPRHRFLSQPRVLRPGLTQYGKVGVRAIPQVKETLECLFRFRHFTGKREATPHSEIGE